MSTLDTTAQNPSALMALQSLEGVVNEFREVTDKSKLNLTQAIMLMYKIDTLTDLVKDQVKAPLENLYNSLKFNIVPTLMEEKTVTSITIDGVGRCNVIDDVRTSVEDKDALMVWMRENELEDLITESVNANTLTAFVRKRLKAGEPMPEHVKVTPFVRAQITKI